MSPSALGGVEDLPRVAVIPVFAASSSAYGKKPQKVLEEILQKEIKTTPVSKKEIVESLEILTTILHEETQKAMDHYYHFRFREAEKLMEGRDDVEAIKVKLLIHQAEGNKEEVKRLCIRLLEKGWKTEKADPDFPPSLKSAFEEVKQGPIRKDQKHLQLGGLFDVTHSFQGAWKERLQKFGRQKHWDKILVYQMEPIGWNHKITGALYSLTEETSPPITTKAGKNKGMTLQAVELVDLADLSRGLRILLRALFFIDSSETIQ